MQVTKYKKGEFKDLLDSAGIPYKLTEKESITDKIISETFVIETKNEITIDEHLSTLDKDSDDYERIAQYKAHKSHITVSEFMPVTISETDGIINYDSFEKYYKQELDKKLTSETTSYFIGNKIKQANKLLEQTIKYRNLIEEWEKFLKVKLHIHESSRNKPLPPQITRTGIKTKEQFNSLDDLFYNIAAASKAYQVLSDFNIIGDEFNFIRSGIPKSVFVVWYQVLEENNLIKQCSKHEFVRLLNSKISKLDISDHTFKKLPGYKAVEFRTDFNTRLLRL